MNQQISTLNKLADGDSRCAVPPPFEAPKERFNLPVLLVVVTLAGLIGGAVAERLGLPQAASLVLFATAYAAGGYDGLRSALASLKAGVVDIDLLMILAAVGAWIVGDPFEGALLLFLFSLSNVLQDYALDRTRSAIRSLIKLRPTEALTRRGGQTIMLPVEQLTPGDVIIVRPGERFAADGIVVEGSSEVDQAAITGESIPVFKEQGDQILAGTINQSGGLEVRVTKLAQESTLARVIALVEQAQGEKANTQRFIDRFEQRYALGVILFTMAVIALPLLFLGQGFSEAFYRGMTVMVAASPCALVISTPATVLSGIAGAAQRGVLFKGGIHLEEAAKFRVIAFDKTGTLTQGQPQLTDIVPLKQGLDAAELLRLAAAVEAKSEHPLARSVVQAAQAQGLYLPAAADFQSVTGKGAAAVIEGTPVHIGGQRYFNGWAHFANQQALGRLEQLQNEGKTVVLVMRGSAQQPELLGLLALADVLRPDVPKVVRRLQAAGVHVVMLSGDSDRVAKAIAAQAGVDAYYADLLPEDKVAQVKALQARLGPVAMVGDGVNDAPALATAHTGIAMGAAGTDVALETADVVLMSDDLKKIPYLLGLSRRTRQTLAINLGFAMTMIVIMIGAIFLFDLPLPLAVLGHEGGTVLVSLHALTLIAYGARQSG